MSSFWQNFNHWLHWKLSFWQLPVQPVMKISSKWRHSRFSVCGGNSAVSGGFSSQSPAILKGNLCHDVIMSQNTSYLKFWVVIWDLQRWYIYFSPFAIDIIAMFIATCTSVLSCYHQGGVTLRLMTLQLKNIINHTQKKEVSKLHVL